MAKRKRYTKEQNEIFERLRNCRQKLEQQIENWGLDHSCHGLDLGNLQEWVDFVLYTWLPDDVHVFVRKKVQFVLLNKTAAATVAYRKRDSRWIIVIHQSDPLGNADGPNIPSSIAHEIAHAWLGHKGQCGQTYSQDIIEEYELEAEMLVESWGVPPCRRNDIEIILQEFNNNA